MCCNSNSLGGVVCQFLGGHIRQMDQLRSLDNWTNSWLLLAGSWCFSFRALFHQWHISNKHNMMFPRICIKHHQFSSLNYKPRSISESNIRKEGLSTWQGFSWLTLEHIRGILLDDWFKMTENQKATSVQPFCFDFDTMVCLLCKFDIRIHQRSSLVIIGHVKCFNLGFWGEKIKEWQILLMVQKSCTSWGW